MNFEQHLLNGIPHADAAEYFLRIRGKHKEASVAEFEQALAELPEAVRLALLKEAMGGPAGVPMMPAAPTLPATAKGQNMAAPAAVSLPATAMGQQSMKTADKTPREAGEYRSRTNFAAGLERDRLTRGERLFGAVGGYGGGAAGAGYGLGVGGALGEAGRTLVPAKYRGMVGAGSAALGALAGGLAGHHVGKGVGGNIGHGLDAKRFTRKEKAAAAFKLALDQMGIEPQLDPNTQQYLAMEQEAQQGAEQNESAFLRQKLEEARAEAQASAEQAQTAQQQADQLQQTQSMVEQQQQQYQAQVADATQKAVAAQDQVLQQQQAAAAMRMAYQQLRGTLLQAASTDPPAMTLGAPGADAAQAAMSQAAGPSNAPDPTAGPAGQAPNPGTPPGSPAPMGDDTVSAPATTSESPNVAAASNKEQQEPTGDAKMAGLRDFITGQAKQLAGRLPHAAAGAAIGAGLGAGEALTSNAPLQQKVQELEGKPDRGFGDTMNLAQSRARLTVGEFAKKHPAMMMGMGALGGAVTGAKEGPELMGGLRQMGGDIKAIGQNIRKGAG